MLQRIFIFSAIIISTLASVTSVFATEKRDYFKDWMVACRLETGYCSAITYINPNPGDGSVADYWLRVGRHRDADHWEISVTTIKTQPQITSYFYAEAAGESFNFVRGGTAVAYGAVYDFFLIGDEANKLFQNMIAGDKLLLNFDAENNQYASIDFSLSGLSASLLWIDDQQSKVGTPRVAGPAPLNLEIAEPKMELPQSIPSDLLAYHAQKSDCDKFGETINANDWEVHQLDNSKLLYMIPCGSGAYNFAFSFYIEDTQTNVYSRLLFADYWEPNGWGGTDVLINAYFDPQNKTISSYYKGRGLGDCGNSGLWQWAEYSFKLVKFNAKAECDGMLEGDEFPQIYPPQ
jgi:hypothetical protein